MFARKEARENFLSMLQANAKLEKDDDGAYTSSAITEMVGSIKEQLQTQYTERKSSDSVGMEQLLLETDNPLTKIKTTTGVSAEDIIKKDKARHRLDVKNRADKGQPTDVINPIISVVDARDTATAENNIDGVVMGTKEATLDHLETEVGIAILGPALNKPNSNKRKKVDDISIAAAIKVAIEGARRPSFDSSNDELTTLVGYSYNWKHTIAQNHDIFTQLATLLDIKGWDVTPSMHVLNIMKNVEFATKQTWGEPLKDEFRKQTTLYLNKKHTDDTKKSVLEALIKADKFRDISASPGTVDHDAEANAVLDYLNYNSMIEDYSDTSEEEVSDDESAYSTSSVSDASADAHYTRRAMKLKKQEQEKKERKAAKKKKADKKDTSRKSSKKSSSKKSSSSKKKDRTQDKDSDLKPALNEACPHCVTMRKSFIHPEPPRKCVWNPKAKVFRKYSICNQMGIEFKPKSAFSYANGGVAPLSQYKKAESSSESDSE